MADDKAISKSLSYWLRHAPEAGGLTLDANGWAPLDAVLGAFARMGQILLVSDIERVVRESDKQRFELSAEGTSIRARQGHSVEVDAGWVPSKAPQTLYHGTVDRFVAAILAEGLRPGKRQHVHLSGDLETARIVGMRRGEPVLLAIAASQLEADGGQFLLSSNGVWLIDRVPPGYISKVA